jgi:alkanesulfonate monooxygenase SsuD/methylene tetrahydromethanopterin reductase-like flavin-dependent oxidoreductase (luciferase family)
VRTGLFCTYENPQKDYRSAYAEQSELVGFVESLGFEEAWVADHHFNPSASTKLTLGLENIFNQSYIDAATFANVAFPESMTNPFVEMGRNFNWKLFHTF